MNNYYNPYNYPYPMPGMVQNQQSSVSTNTYAFVNGIEGAKSYLMQPNQNVLLMDSDAPMCYMKQSNGMGQSTIRAFKLEEVSLNSNIGQQNQEFALKSDFKALSDKLEVLEKKLEGGENNA